MENFSKSRTGRPRVIQGAELKSVVDLATGNPNASERTRQNKFYQLRAMNLLDLSLDDGAEYLYPWIWGRPHEPKPGDHKVRWTILAELGRIEDAETMRAVAARICELKPPTREALRMIRRFRIGGAKPGDSLELANELIATINDYMNRRPGLTFDDVRGALRTAAGQLPS